MAAASAAYPWVRKTVRPYDEIKWAVHTSTTTPELLLHMERHYTDWMIEKDVDCVLDVCGDNDEARGRVLRYATTRRKAPGFKPGHPGHNNHTPGVLRPVSGPQGGRKAPQTLRTAI